MCSLGWIESRADASLSCITGRCAFFAPLGTDQLYLGSSMAPDRYEEAGKESGLYRAQQSI
jgi:hypothetical protein